MKVALIGVGLMGWPMGVRLCESGLSLRAYNRSHEKALRLADHGAEVFRDPCEAVSTADVVITVLEHGQAVHDVLFHQKVAQAMPRGALLMDMSSVKPAEAQAHASALQAMGLRHLDAPVSGGTVGAQAGTLAIMVGGDPEDFARAAEILKTLGRPVHVGAHGAGQLAKLANQMIVGITIGAVAEALQFARCGGADMAHVRDAVRGGFAESRVLEIHGQRMVDRDFVKRAAVDVQLKDLRNALSTAASMHCAMPITQKLMELYERTAAAGWGDLDHSALLMAIEAMSAAPPTGATAW
jgi:3-hydroxyisobutyrate dehydrogenase-like beta-hydroxyacid dehydrogenase